MDGFAELMTKITIDAGVPESCIFTTKNELPGYFRPSKEWDFIIISRRQHLIAAIEFKSQVGSFGNNFNNRVEESLGVSDDFFTAYQKNLFGAQEAPWLGYLMLAQRSKGSTSSVRLSESHFPVMADFRGSSYLDRYKILCERMMKERRYNYTCLIWTTERRGKNAPSFGYPDPNLSFEKFANSYLGYISGKADEFKR